MRPTGRAALRCGAWCGGGRRRQGECPARRRQPGRGQSPTELRLVRLLDVRCEVLGGHATRDEELQVGPERGGEDACRGVTEEVDRAVAVRDRGRTGERLVDD